MSENEYVPAADHETGPRLAFRARLAVLSGLAVPLLLMALVVWALLVLWAFIVAAHWAAELACGWEWLRC